MDKIIIEFDGKDPESLKAHNRCLKSDDMVSAMVQFLASKELLKNYVKALVGSVDNKYDEDVLSKKIDAINIVYDTFEEILKDYEINIDTI